MSTAHHHRFSQRAAHHWRCAAAKALALTALMPGLAPAWAASEALWLAPADVEALQQDAKRTAPLLKRCDKELEAIAAPVAVFAPPPHYTSSGVVETEMSKRFASDGSMAWRAALCFAVSGDRRHARHAQALLTAWADTLTSVPSEQGASEINFDLPAYVLAASLVRGVEGWSDAGFRRLLTHIALPLSHSLRKNNHGNWGVLLEASIAAYIGDGDLLAKARARWLKLVDSQIDADGVLTQEICRSDTNDYCGGAHQGVNGLSYTHYTLLPATAAARVFDLQGRSVWQTREGRKLAAAYRQAAAWTLHPERFPFYERNGGRLNGVRNAAYFALLQRQYPNDDGAAVLASGALGMNALEWRLVFD
ncbi:alginate lyase family protein [Pelomonas aquatica]|jgi:hypothetical protein|nr:alginate lyase family protein [Pelomonas aquatica]